MKHSKYFLFVKASPLILRVVSLPATTMLALWGLFGAPMAQAQTEATATATATTAGQVMFVLGRASKQPESGEQQAITKDMAVKQGDKLVTASDAYVYVRMADGALLVLRPGSSLSIDLWRFNSEKPELSQIKYTLHQGLSRYVSGSGSQAAKEKFRFNTPLAAIGVRGTDFTVLAETGVTEVSVRSGGVVVSAFGGACLKEAVGPCEGGLATELFANPKAGFLQLKAGEQRPQLIRSNGKTGPDQSNPALTNEPHAKDDKSGGNSPNMLATNLYPGIEKVPDQWLLKPLAAWGRWGVASTEAERIQIVTSLISGRDLVAINSYYVLVRNPGMIESLPETGTGNFKLVKHEGIVVNTQTGAFESTKAIDGNLSIDFGKARFQTDLKLEAAGQTIQVGAAGSVESGGVLRSDLFISPTFVQGVVGGAGAGQASYIYRRSSTTGPEFSGAANWSR
jgi:hypothetical protein